MTMLSNFEKKLKKRMRVIVGIHALRGYLVTLVTLSVLAYLVLAALYYFRIIPPFSIPVMYFCVGALALPVAVASLIACLDWRNTRGLTVLLEEHYPHLRERLLTLLELSSRPESLAVNPLSSMLANSLEGEMSELLDRFGFGKASSGKKLLLPGVLVLSLCLLGTVHALVEPDFFRVTYMNLIQPLKPGPWEALRPSGEALPLFEIQVLPGHCAIPKGSSLTVRAKIPDYRPKQVKIFMRTSEDGAWQVFPMQQTPAGDYEYALTHLSAPSFYYVKADHQQSETFEIRILESFGLAQAHWRLEFPVHTRLAEQRLDGWRHKISVPRGTVIHLNLAMTRPVRDGWLGADGGGRYPLSAEPSGILTASFTARADTLLHLEAQSTSGEPLMGVEPVWIQTLPDLPPYFEVLEPQFQNYVFPTEEIPFVIKVNDDYGIASVMLVLHFHGREERIEWLPAGQIPESIHLEKILDLERFRLHSKDLIFGYLEIRDNDPEDGGHLVRSSLFTFLIRDFIEQFKISVRPPDEPSLRELFEDLLVAQEKILEDTWDFLSIPSDDVPTGWEEEPPNYHSPETNRALTLPSEVS